MNLAGTILIRTSIGLILFAQCSCFLNSKISSLNQSSADTSENISPAILLPDPLHQESKDVMAMEAQIQWHSPSGTVVAYRVSLSSASSPSEYCKSNIELSSTASLTFEAVNLVPDSTYYYRICSLSGETTSPGVTGMFKTLKLLARASTYPSFSNWNDYLRNDGAKFYNATSAVCTDVVVGSNACINGGLASKVVIPQVIACDRIKISDKLGVFTWGCDTTASDTILYSIDLQSYKGLMDLIENNQFKKNQVIVKVDGLPVYSSSSEKWWTNVIESLPDSANGTTTTLTNGGSPSGKIFTVSNQKIGGSYAVNEDKIAIVVLKGATLIKDATTTTSLILPADSTKFLWFEGRFNGNNQSVNIFRARDLSHSRFHNIEMFNATGGLFLVYSSFTESHSNKVTDFYMHHAGYGTDGFSSSGMYASLFTNGKVMYTGSGLRYLGTYTGVQNVIISGTSGTRGAIAYPDGPFVTNVTIVNNATSNSIYVFLGAWPLFHNILAINSGYGGSIYSYTGSGGTYSQIVSAGATSEEIVMQNTSNSIRFTNNLVFENLAECLILNDGAGSPGLTNDGLCNNAGTSNATKRVAAFDLTKIFVGKVAANDSANSSDTMGIAPFASILDWTSYENFYRIWAKDGSAFPNVDNRGLCDSGNCRIWDYRLKADSANQAYNNTDTVIAKNSPFVPGMTCPTFLHGNVVTTHTHLGNATTFTFLTNAAEIPHDGIGNDNALCESNESCLYTPNFGAYQGEGDYYANGTCTFQNGTISNVKVYAYPTNGVP